MDTIAEYTARTETMSIFELRRERAGQLRIIRDTEHAGELVDLDEWAVLDALHAEIAARRC